MTQPAKAQEPSMEEILASIRRIIADDEAKPTAAAPSPAPAPAAPPPRPAEPAAKAPPPKPAAAPPPRAAAPTPKPPEPKPAAAPPPAAKNSQDEIDAMLAGLDADTTVAEVRPPPPAPEPADDVFELTEQMTVAEPFQTIEPQNDIEFTEAPAPPLPPPAPEPPPRPAARMFEERVRERVVEDIAPALTRPLMSHNTVAAVDSAFNALAQTVLSNNARTLEDLVKEMLRPMLKAWLDDNLPNMVEKIVRAEIERVSRGR
jgi:cell pole-organizing protein PopZ